MDDSTPLVIPEINAEDAYKHNGVISNPNCSTIITLVAVNAINNLSWTTREKEAIMKQMDNLSSIVNYPGSYIMARYMKFAFLKSSANASQSAFDLTCV